MGLGVQDEVEGQRGRDVGFTRFAFRNEMKLAPSPLQLLQVRP